MSARAALIVLFAASAGAAGYLWWQQHGAAGAAALPDIPTDDPAWPIDGNYSLGSDAGGEYDVAGGGGIADALMPVVYRVENVFTSAYGDRMNLSLAGLAHIEQFEGYSATPYKDAAGYWTIGYGHRLRSGEWYDSIDQATAQSLLAQDVGSAEDAVNSLVRVALSQNQFDALVSFVYNVGAGAFRRSTMLAKLNAGDYAGAAAEFPRWRLAGGRVVQGLVNRRYAEASLFNSGGVA